MNEEKSKFETLMFRAAILLGGVMALLFLLIMAAAENRQAKGWEALPNSYERMEQASLSSRVVATTSTAWEADWTGMDTTESVSASFYVGDDLLAWGEAHKARVLALIEGRR